MCHVFCEVLSKWWQRFCLLFVNTFFNIRFSSNPRDFNSNREELEKLERHANKVRKLAGLFCIMIIVFGALLILISQNKNFQKRNDFKFYLHFLFGLCSLLLVMSCLYIVFKGAIKSQPNRRLAGHCSSTSPTIERRTATPTLQQFRTATPALQHIPTTDQSTKPTLKYSTTRKLEPVSSTGFRRPYLNPMRYPNTFVVEDESKTSMQSSSSSYPTSYSSLHRPLIFTGGAADFDVQIHRDATPTEVPQNQEPDEEETQSCTKSVASKLPPKTCNPLSKIFSQGNVSPQSESTQSSTKSQSLPLGDSNYAEASSQDAVSSKFGAIAHIKDEITKAISPKKSKKKVIPEQIESDFSSSSMEDIFDIEVQAAMLKHYENMKLREASDKEQPGCSHQHD